MKYLTFITTALIILLTGILLAGCKKDKTRMIDSSYKPDVNPAKFTKSTDVNNPYHPVTSDKKYIYEGETSDGMERIEEQRLNTTKIILGITCIVVNFKAFLDGKLIEEAYDWYAQDNEGTVWYFGEAVDNYNPDGTLKDHSGSWEAGVDGAQPGTIMPAHPEAGMAYREEYCFNHAEDRAQILETGVTVTTPLGTFTNCIKTKNWTELEPDLNENKFYAPGVGLVKEVDLNENVEIKLVAVQ